MAHHVSFTFRNGHPCLESRAEKVASSILAETFVLFLQKYLYPFVRFGRQDFLMDEQWMDGWHHEGKIDWKGMEKLAGFDARLKGMGGKEKLVKGALFEFFHFFWIERNDDDNFFSSPVSCTSSSSLL